MAKTTKRTTKKQALAEATVIMYTPEGKVPLKKVPKRGSAVEPPIVVPTTPKRGPGRPKKVRAERLVSTAVGVREKLLEAIDSVSNRFCRGNRAHSIRVALEFLVLNPELVFDTIEGDGK